MFYLTYGHKILYAYVYRIEPLPSEISRQSELVVQSYEEKTGKKLNLLWKN